MAVAPTEYPHVFKFSDHTKDVRLLKYDAVLQQLYQRVLNYGKTIPLYAQNFADAAANKKLAVSKLHGIVQLIKNNNLSSLIPKSKDKSTIIALFNKQYEPSIMLEAWPPLDYPDVPHDKEISARLPPLYQVPCRKTLATLYATYLPLRGILDNTANPALKGKTLQEAFALLKQIEIPASLTDDHQRGIYLIRKALADDTANSVNNLNEWNRDGETINDILITQILSTTSRFYNHIVGNASWIDALTSDVYNTSYSEFDYSMHGQPIPNSNRLLQNRNQQAFIALSATENITGDLMLLSGTEFKPIADFAWLKFNYSFRPSDRIDTNILTKIIAFQGYRLMDMPPPPILKAFAHGRPIDMAPHVRTLFPEWTNPETCAAWLDTVMAKWLSDILLLTIKLQQTICKGGVPNDQVWHLRDVPTIQMDLFNDVLAYIVDKRGIAINDYRQQIVDKGEANYMAQLKQIHLKGGWRKTYAKSKGMRHTRKAMRSQQRGGAATGMPLAYFQDGAQMHGTYAEPTGVGLAGSTGSMARVGITQTGGRRQNGKRRANQNGKQQQGGKQGSRRHQNGGFAPSIMGQMVVNGSYLMPVASYMGYKMIKGKRSTSRSASRGPRSTHKKRR